MWHYARGVAHAARRDFAAATAEADAIATIERTADFSLLTVVGIPAPDVLKLARTVIAARIAQAQGDTGTAVARFAEAAALQDTLPYTEPPYWYYPVRQSLGAALLQAGGSTRRKSSSGSRSSGAQQRLVLFRARRALQGARRHRRRAQGEADLAKTWIGDRALLKLSNL